MSSELVIGRVDWGDAGVYSCVAREILHIPGRALEEPSRQNILLDVFGKFSLSIHSLLSEFRVGIAKSYFLTGGRMFSKSLHCLSFLCLVTNGIYLMKLLGFFRLELLTARFCC